MKKLTLVFFVTFCIVIAVQAQEEYNYVNDPLVNGGLDSAGLHDEQQYESPVQSDDYVHDTAEGPIKVQFDDSALQFDEYDEYAYDSGENDEEELYDLAHDPAEDAVEPAPIEFNDFARNSAEDAIPPGESAVHFDPVDSVDERWGWDNKPGKCRPPPPAIGDASKYLCTSQISGYWFDVVHNACVYKVITVGTCHGHENLIMNLEQCKQTCYEYD